MVSGKGFRGLLNSQAKVYCAEAGFHYVKLEELWETTKFRDQITKMAKIPTSPPTSGPQPSRYSRLHGSLAGVQAAQDIARATKGRKVGDNHWRAFCPAHDDGSSPSLKIYAKGSGIVLVHCFGGCSQQEVIGALRSMGLWGAPSPRLDALRYLRSGRRDSLKAKSLAYHARIDHIKIMLLLAEYSTEPLTEVEKAGVRAARKELIALLDEVEGV